MWFMSPEYAALGVDFETAATGRACKAGHAEVRWDASAGELCWFCGGKGFYSPPALQFRFGGDSDGAHNTGTCWARPVYTRCHNAVDPDPEHLGLCADCHRALCPA